MAKSTIVKLMCQETGKLFEFEADHAERILQMRDSGWELPKDSEYEFKDGNLNRRAKKDSK